MHALGRPVKVARPLALFHRNRPLPLQLPQCIFRPGYRPPVAGADARPLLIPLRFALYAADGSRMDARVSGDAALRDDLIELTAAQHTLVFDGLRERPLPSFNQGFSAPVKLHHDYTPDALASNAALHPALVEVFQSEPEA